jgi:hypothetical protein
MRYLLFISATLLAACQSSYKTLVPSKGDPACIRQFKPAFTTVLYRTHCMVRNKMITGILLIKSMPDSSLRIVFTGETGIKFFDFEYNGDSLFRVRYIMKQLDKPAVIKTLRKDFDMILWHHTLDDKARVFLAGNLRYYRFEQEQGFTYYITDSACSRFLRVERGTSKKKVAEAVFERAANRIPDSIGIVHRNFDMTILLKRI